MTRCIFEVTTPPTGPPQSAKSHRTVAACARIVTEAGQIVRLIQKPKSWHLADAVEHTTIRCDGIAEAETETHCCAATRIRTLRECRHRSTGSKVIAISQNKGLVSGGFDREHIIQLCCNHRCCAVRVDRPPYKRVSVQFRRGRSHKGEQQHRPARTHQRM